MPVAEPEPGVAAGGGSRSIAAAAGIETQAAGTVAAPLRGFQTLSPLARARSPAPHTTIRII